MIDGWVAQGIITPEQAARMRESRRLGAPDAVAVLHPARSSLAVEALGYLGGLIAAVATLLIAAQYWSQISTPVHMLIVGVAAAALLTAGLAVPERLGEAGVRLRAVLWLGSTAATSGFLAVLGNEALAMDDADVMLFTAAGTTALATGLWAVHRVIVQQIAMMVGAMLVAAAAIADFVMSDALPGVGVWGVGAVWLLLGWGGLLRPRRAAVALGGASAVVGAMITVSSDAGIIFAIVTTALIVSVAVLFQDLVLLAVGALGVVQVLPAALTRWFPDSLAAPFALLWFGGMLVGAALWIARRRRVRDPEATRTSHDHSIGQPAVALRVAAAVVVAVVGFVLAVALT